MAWNSDNVLSVTIGVVIAIAIICGTVLIFHNLDNDKKKQPFKTKEKIALFDACKQNEPSKIGECIRIAQGFNK